MPAPVENDPVKLVAQINETITKMNADNKTLTDELKASTSAAGADAKEALKICNDLASKIQQNAAVLVELEQKLGEATIKGRASVETLGSCVIKSDAYKQFVNGQTSKFKIEANTITGQSGDNSSDTLVPAQRLPGIIPGAYRVLRVRDALPSANLSSNALEYTRELVFTNSANETAEAAQKPESSLTFELVNAPVRTIAHFIKATKQILEDSAALQSYIDTRMRYGVDLRYENQLINGNGTGQNISGILDSGNHTVFNPMGTNYLDNVNRAIENVEMADYIATAIMMNPRDWYRITRLKVGSSDARYIVGDPTGTIQPILWGKPVIVTSALPVGTFVTGAFDIAYQVWNRSGTVVEMFEQDDTNVQKNLVTIRAENRGLLATYRPASVQAGLLTTANS